MNEDGPTPNSSSPESQPVNTPEMNSAPVNNFDREETTAFAPNQPQPAAGETGVVTPPLTLAPKKSRKGLIIGIVIAAVVVLLGAGFTIFALTWTNPKNVMDSAIANYFTKEHVQANTKINLDIETTSGGMIVKFNDVDVNLSSNVNPEFDLNAKINMSLNGQDLSLAGAVAFSSNGDLYFRISDVATAIRQLFGASAPAEFMASVQEIDNKWVKVTPEDLEEQNPGSADDYRCVIDAVKSIKDNKSYLEQSKKAYEANPFLKYDGEAKSKDGLVGYDVTIDQEKLRSFGDAIKETDYGKKLTACGEQSTSAANEVESTAESFTTDSKTKITLWANAWGHELKQIETSSEVEVEDGTKDITSVTDLNYDASVKLTTPEADMTLTEFVTKVQDLVGQMYSV